MNRALRALFFLLYTLSFSAAFATAVPPTDRSRQLTSIHSSVYLPPVPLAPAISYAGAQTFTVGKAITTLVPTNKGGAVPNGLVGQVSLLAGNGSKGYADGTGAAASFNFPAGIVVDANGNTFVADQNNRRIRKITPAGVVSTFVGNGESGTEDGTGIAASIGAPVDMIMDSKGNMYISDATNNILRKITPAGVVTTLAGSGTNATVDGTGKEASFSSIANLAIDGSDNIYVLEYNTGNIRKVTPAGVVTTAVSALGAYTVSGIAADKAGNIFAAYYGADNGYVMKITTDGIQKDIAAVDWAIEFMRTDANGNVILADGARVVKITPAGTLSTIASGFGLAYCVALDAAGNVYVGDYSNATVSKIPAAGYAVNPALPQGLALGADGKISGTPTGIYPTSTFVVTATNASGSSSYNLNITVNPAILPPSITYNTSQAIYPTGKAITTLTPANTGGVVPAGVYGTVSTFAGSVSGGSSNGTGTAAKFNGPLGMATDAAGNLYVADENNNMIRKITPAGVVTTFAGSGAYALNDGTGTAATFKHPTGLAVDGAGNVYVADQGNNRIRKITPQGVVTSYAGADVAGSADGPRPFASFNYPTAIAIDYLGNLYITDLLNQKIRKISADGMTVSTVAGNGTLGGADGQGTAATFNYPTGIFIDNNGYVYVTDQNNHKIRKITPGGYVSTIAGTGFSGSADGAAGTFYNPYAIAVDATGTAYVADYNNNEVRAISPDGTVKTIAGTTTAGSANGVGTAAGFSHPSGIALDGKGNLYVSEYFNNEIRKVSVIGYTIAPASLPAGLKFNTSTGVISGTPTAALAPTVYTVTAFNGGGGSSATLNLAVKATVTTVKPPVIKYTSPAAYTAGVAISALKVSNTGGAVPANTFGTTLTYAGTGDEGSLNGQAIYARFNEPRGVAADVYGNVYVADEDNELIRKIYPNGLVNTLAGSGGYGAVNGPGVSATFSDPKGIAVDANGNVYVSDSGGEMIRKITPDGTVVTVAGTGQTGKTNGTAKVATFSSPKGIAVDAAGNVYVVDAGNNIIRKITPLGIVSTLAGSGKTGSTNGQGTAASFNDPIGLTADASGNVYVADGKLIRKISTTGLVSTLAGSSKAGLADGTGTAASFTDAELITIDPVTGLLYVLDGDVLRSVTTTGIVTTLVTTQGLSDPYGIAADGAGNLYVGDTDNNLIRKIPLTGYRITPALPAGLILDATGQISGTPMATSTSTKYTVTAYNSGGSGSATITFAINAPVLSKAPVIDYGAAKSFTEGVALLVKPTNTGGAIPPNTVSTVTTYAGNGSAASTNAATATAASFKLSQSTVAYDNFGNMYVAEYSTNLIRKVNVLGTVTTLAGSGKAGAANGTGAAASFNGPNGIATDPSGNIYVSDSKNYLIRKITPSGVVTTLAGTGKSALTDGLGTAAAFKQVNALCVSPSGLIYVNDYNSIRTVTTYGFVTTRFTDLSLQTTVGIATDGGGSVYLTGSDNYIRRLTTSNLLYIYVGNGTAGYSDGTGDVVSFNNPQGIAATIAGYVYIADAGNNRIRQIDPYGNVSTFAGSGQTTLTNGLKTISAFNAPNSVALDRFQNVYVSDAGHNVIRKIGLTGYSYYGSLPGGVSMDYFSGIISGTPTSVMAQNKYIIVAYNNGGTSADTVSITINNTVKASTSPNINTIAGTGVRGSTGDGGLAKVATLSSPYGMAVDKAGNIYIASFGDSKIRKVDAVTKKISTIAGTGLSGYNGDGILATKASLNLGACGIAVDNDGNIYFGDYYNNRVRKIDAKTQKISTIAGNGSQGKSGDGELATGAQLWGPAGVAVDANNNIYIADANNRVIRRVDAKTKLISTVVSGLGYVERVMIDSKGYLYYGDEGYHTLYKMNTVTTATAIIAGNGIAGYAGDGGLAMKASLTTPMGITVDALGNVYVVDQSSDVIRKIDATTQNISTYAGVGLPGYTGDGSPAVQAKLNYLTDIVIDAAGDMYVDDYSNNVIRKIGGQEQAITFPTIAAKKTGIADFSPGATANSGLVVTYTSSNKGVATIVSGKIHIVAAGTSVITASQAGDISYAAATPVTKTLTVTKAAAAAHSLELATDDLAAGDPVVKPSISPNGDGVNDVLIIDHISSYPQNKLTLIDPNGNKIYEVANYDNVNKVYAGKSNVNGLLQKAGTYYYLLDYKDGDEVKHKTGYVIIKY